MALARVAQRVAQGGHAVPEDVVRRRYKVGWRNLIDIYKGLVNGWQVFDNAGPEPMLIDEGGTL